ncbi:MAG: hypothetical protein IT461_06230 [Planctomycetes bacterium]|nr:hypothetical protein [Planctomycetota bacterium]
MARDVTTAFEQARTTSNGWAESNMLALVNAIAEANRGSVVDWDEGTGEEWAAVISQRRVVAVVWIHGPLVFLNSKAVQIEDNQRAIQWIRFTKWEENEFSIDSTRVDEFFGPGRWVREIDPTSFSANALWWTTV